MKKRIILLAIGALLASLSQAQQNPPTPQPPAAPCNTPAPAPPHRQGWLEKKARALACQKNKNLCDIPSSPTDVTGTVPAPKPCNPVPVPKPQPVPPAAPAPPDFVCPPKAKLIAGHPYCIYPDNTVVDAIPLSPAAQQPKQ